MIKKKKINWWRILRALLYPKKMNSIWVDKVKAEKRQISKIKKMEVLASSVRYLAEKIEKIRILKEHNRNGDK